jgi:hypothetical protein
MVAVDPGLVQPPAEATIMDLSASLDGNRVFDAYVSAIKETFGSEPWEDIERFAERVWAECRFDGDPDWAGIRERIRAEWPMARPASQSRAAGNPFRRAIQWSRLALPGPASSSQDSTAT